MVPAYAGYIQDDWRVTPKLTVNMGLRYEYQPPITEKYNQMGNFDPNSATGLVQLGGQISELYHGDHNNFAPRLGLAWDITGKGTTVLRAGSSVIYSSPPLQNFIGAQGAQLNLMPTGFTLVNADGSTRTSPGDIQVGTVALTPASIHWNANTPVFNASGSGLRCGNGIGSNGSPCSLKAINPNIRTPYVTQWTLGIQHAFTNNLSLDVSYVGMHGTKLVGVIDENVPTPGAKNGSGAATIGHSSHAVPTSSRRGAHSTHSISIFVANCRVHQS